MKLRSVIFILLLSGCLNQDNKLFTLMPPEKTGIDFRNDLHPTPEFNMYTYRNFYNGGGVGLGDFNNDGWLDIFFCGNMVDNRLYLNRRNFIFEDITDSAGVSSTNIWSSGVSIVDINGDGWLDIYVCKSGRPGGERRHNELYINNGDLTFIEKAKEYGIADEGFSTHAAFFDYDLDGDLDLYLLNNSFRSVGGYDMRPGLRDIRDTLGGNKLYRNMTMEMDLDHDSITNPIYKDVSEVAGIYGSNIGFGLGVTIGDVNRDGYPDIYVSNDFFERDYLYINNHDGTFSEELTTQMNEISMGSMGADMADINNDGFPEIFVTEMLPRSDARYKTKMTFENWDKYQLAVQSGYHHQFARNTLQLNNKNGTFSEIGRLAGVHSTDWSWSALIADFDNDGWKDIYVSNGIFKDLLDQDYINFYSNDPKIIQAIRNREETAILQLMDKIPSEPISNFAFKNTGNLGFKEVTAEWGLEIPSFSNGSVYGDLDNDGDLDLVINNVNMPVFVFRNNAEQKKNHYIQISLKGYAHNQFAIGAQSTIVTDSFSLYQELAPMRGFQSSTDYRLTFGLGQMKKINELKVRWPDGKMSIVHGPEINQNLEISYRDSSDPDSPPDLAETAPLLLPDIPLFSYRHQENDFIDFDRDQLLFYMLSAEGPKMCKGDVNADGLEDIFIGGASGYPGTLFLQKQEGYFFPYLQESFENDKLAEDQESVFFDVDQDGDLDLLVCSGGNEFQARSRYLADRIYLNDGYGKFNLQPGAFIDAKPESSSCLAVCDFDRDGLPDLFIGTRLIPGIYGLPVNGYLWKNTGNGYFKDVTDIWAPELHDIGMITDAEWTDINGDGLPDLVVVGEWMPVSVFIHSGKKLENFTKQAGLMKSHGLWKTISASDLDKDGKPDLILGNHGLNSRLKASREKPLILYTNDFDENQTPEQILTMYNGTQSYPLVLRHDLVQQLPVLKKKYLLFENYKEQTIEDIFDERQIRTSARVEVTELRTMVAWNEGNGRFTLQALPMEAQFSPVYACLTLEVPGKNKPFILLGGNFYHAKPEIGKYDASFGLFLEYEDQRQWHVLPSQESGFLVHGEIRHFLTVGEGKDQKILIGRNQEEVMFYKINPLLYPLR